VNKYRQILPGRMHGTVSPPPSKSISHRMLILGALSNKAFDIHNILRSEDIDITWQALIKMGFKIDLVDDTIHYSGKQEIPKDPVHIFLGNSGTSARLLSAVAALVPGVYIFDGTPRMRKRPMAPLIQALSSLGVSIEHDDGYLPFKISGGTISGTEVYIDVSKSSQFLSALLLISPFLKKFLKIYTSKHMASGSYVDLTISILEKCGIKVQRSLNSYLIEGRQQVNVDDVIIEGDYSSAAYFAAGASISGGEVFIKNIIPDSWQGDRIILEIAGESGADIIWKNNGVTVKGNIQREIDRDMHNFPDLVPTVAVMALFAPTSSRFQNVQQLRFKESDRLTAIIENIERLQGFAMMDKNDLIIKPRALTGAKVLTHNDHRIAMSFALAGLNIANVFIENPDCVKKSFPAFWDHMDRLVN
jgi:3-phosphoshikimate 1-carboxyvinyltransferase